MRTIKYCIILSLAFYTNILVWAQKPEQVKQLIKQYQQTLNNPLIQPNDLLQNIFNRENIEIQDDISAIPSQQRLSVPDYLNKFKSCNCNIAFSDITPKPTFTDNYGNTIIEINLKRTLNCSHVKNTTISQTIQAKYMPETQQWALTAIVHNPKQAYGLLAAPSKQKPTTPTPPPTTIASITKPPKTVSPTQNSQAKKTTSVKPPLTKSTTKQTASKAQPKAKTITQPKAKTITQPKAKTITQPKAKTITQPKAKTITQPIPPPCNCEDCNNCCTTLKINRTLGKDCCTAVKDTLNTLNTKYNALKDDTENLGKQIYAQKERITKLEKDSIARDSLKNIIIAARKAPITVYCILNENTEDEKPLILNMNGLSKEDYKQVKKQKPRIKISCPINPSLFPKEIGKDTKITILLEEEIVTKDVKEIDACFGEDSSIEVQKFYQQQANGQLDCNFASFEDKEDENPIYTVKIKYQNQDLSLEQKPYRFKIAAKQESNKKKRK